MLAKRTQNDPPSVREGVPEADPFSRQMFTSQGTFLERLDLVARERGLPLEPRFRRNGPDTARRLGGCREGRMVSAGYRRALVDPKGDVQEGFQNSATDQLRLEASPIRRAMTTAGNRTPRVDRKVASILAEILTA